MSSGANTSDLFGATAAGGTRRRSAIVGEAGFQRLAGDAYFTEPWITRALLAAVTLRGPVWEPAVGRGDMAQILEAAGLEVIGSDLYERGYAGWIRVDFLKARQVLTTPRGEPPGAIVTNPPYGTEGASAEGFVRQALELMVPLGGQVAMLLRHEWDCAGSRRELFERQPFALKLTLTRRPRWDWWTGQAPISSPRHNFAWFVWDAAHSGRPQLAWGP